MRAARRIRLLALALATAMLAASAWAAWQAQARWVQARAQTQAVRTELAQLQSLQPMIEQRERYDSASLALRAMLARAAVNPSQWVNRQIHHAATTLSRPDAEALLSQQLGQGAGQWLAADAFELAVLSPNAGLFTPPLPDDKGVSVEVSGTVYFPASQR